jgi:Flp pilus assembly protein TadG
MKLFKKILCFKRDSKGASMVEFALSLPLLVLISLGIYETTTYIMISQKLNEIASGVANWVSARPTSAVISDCLIGANLVGKDYSFSTKGTVVVTGIQTTGSPAVQTVVWQMASAGGASKIITSGGTTIVSAPFSIANTASIIVAEVSYNYTPTFSYFLTMFPAITITKVAQMVPRSGLAFSPLPAS